MNRLERLNL
jgi:citrate synthase